MKSILISILLILAVSLTASPCCKENILQGKVELPDNSVISYSDLTAQLFSSRNEVISEKLPISADGTFEIKYIKSGSKVYVFEKHISVNDPSLALLTGYLRPRKGGLINAQTTANHVFRMLFIKEDADAYSGGAFRGLNYKKLREKSENDLRNHIENQLINSSYDNRNLSTYYEENSKQGGIFPKFKASVDEAIEEGELEHSLQYIVLTTITQDDKEAVLERLVSCEINQGGYDIKTGESDRKAYEEIGYIARQELKSVSSGTLKSGSISKSAISLYGAKMNKFYLTFIGEWDSSLGQPRDVARGDAAVLSTTAKKLKKNLDMSVDIEATCKDKCFEETLQYSKKINTDHMLFLGTRKHDNSVLLACIRRANY